MQKEEKRIFTSIVIFIIVIILGITVVSYVSRYDSDTKNYTKISVGEAREIALDDAHSSEKNVVFTKQERDREHGIYAYEIEFNDGITMYEYEINAQTGEIIKRYSKMIY